MNLGAIYIDNKLCYTHINKYILLLKSIWDITRESHRKVK